MYQDQGVRPVEKLLEQPRLRIRIRANCIGRNLKQRSHLSPCQRSRQPVFKLFDDVVPTLILRNDSSAFIRERVLSLIRPSLPGSGPKHALSFRTRAHTRLYPAKGTQRDAGNRRKKEHPLHLSGPFDVTVMVY